MAFHLCVFRVRSKYSRTQMHPLILLKEMNTGTIVYSTGRMALPPAVFQAGFTGVYLFAWNPKTLTASLSWLLLHCTYFKPCKQAINIFGKQAKLCRMSDIQDSSEGFLVRALLNILARPLLSRWDFPWSCPSTPEGCIVLLLAGTMLCYVQQAHGFRMGRCCSWGWLGGGTTQWYSTVNSFKDGYNGIFLLDAFYFNLRKKKHLSTQDDAYQQTHPVAKEASTLYN